MIQAGMLNLQALLTQKAIIERDSGVPDQFGAEAAIDWAPRPDPIPCFMWWGTGATITRMGSIRGKPEATVDLNTGGIVLAANADVTGHDRIARVLDANDDTLEEGPFEILAVSAFEGLTELSFRRIS